MAPERRSNFRAPVLGHMQAEIVCGKTRFPVDLIDESAGGMLVASRQRPGVREGDIVQLRLGDHRVEARVAHVQRRGLGARIGLERVGESAVDEAGNSHSEAGAQRSRPRPTRTIAIVLLAGAILTAIGGAVLYNAPQARSDLHRISTVLHRGDDYSPPIGLTRDPLPRSMKQKIRQHQGLDVFSVTEVVENLHLTESQLVHIQRVADEAQEAAEELGLESPFTAEAAEHRQFQQLLAGLQVQAVSVLDPLQKRRLEELLEQAVSGTQLLQRVAQHHWPHASAAELFEKLGAAALTLPRVADELQLTAEQRQTINQAVDEALDASEELAARRPDQTSGEDPAAEARALLDDVRRQVLERLSGEQRARLGSEVPEVEAVQ